MFGISDFPGGPVVKNLPAIHHEKRWAGGSTNGDCSHETKRRLLLGRKVMTNLDSILKSRDITLSTKQSTDVHMVSDSDGDDFEDASEFGVDDGEVFGMASSALRKSPMSEFLTMCNRHFGSVVAQTIRTQKTDQFPLFLIIMGKRSSNEVLNVIQGKREAHEREMAEQFRLEQIRKEQEEEREAIRLSLEQALPPEPKEENAEPVSKLRIRTPSGEFLERRFLASNKLQIVFDFVASKGFPWDEFKLLSTFPRRDSFLVFLLYMKRG
ncbi:hypothetical protein FD755_003248 [Muntiacus reevesi]|uniref:UBX domain-containing protein n=1 Tax=Muntiacus reevesi TaxID=9886 RepID=A0A5J5N7W7_MUNRE|nr:hypothetical protein FD755_003248 [Muntiacus reevesi]